MKIKTEKERILILGGSGFIGQSLYRELQPYYDVQGTYFSQDLNFRKNNAYHYFDAASNSVKSLLEKTKPTIIIVAIRTANNVLEKVYQEVAEYISKNPKFKFIIFSSSAVFDAKRLHPSYDNDVPLSISTIGKNEIGLEKILMENIPNQLIIARVPLILGFNSPLIFHLKQCIKHYAAFEVFPNLVITATTIRKLQQQIHYIINRSLTGIFHLSSKDMIHHDELFREITSKISNNIPIFKNVYSSNEDRYDALLSRKNRLPKTYQISISEVIEESSLTETVSTIF